jgi:hypothetical protein
VNQRRGAATTPVLDSGVGKEDLRDLRGLVKLKERAAFTMKFLFVRRERKSRRGEQHRCAPRHSESLVERAAGGSRDVRPHGVEHPPILLVSVEPS